MVLEILATSKCLIEVPYPSRESEYLTPRLPSNFPGRARSVNKCGLYYSNSNASVKDDGSLLDVHPGSISNSKASDSVTYLENLECDLLGRERNCSGVNFLRLKFPSNGSLFEEQEISAFIMECPYEDTPPPFVGSSAPSPFESLYSEPIYGNSTILDSNSNFGESNPVSPTPWSYQSSNYPSTDNDYGGSIYSFGQTSYWSNNDKVSRHPEPGPGPGSEPDYSDTFHGMRTLPPPPPQSRSKALPTPTETASKISTIAKTAGRKIAKKFLSMRRVTRTFEVDSRKHENLPQKCDSAPGRIRRDSQGHGRVKEEVTRLNEKSNGNANGRSSGSSSGNVVRRAISRPSIPPPEPPPMETIPRHPPPPNQNTYGSNINNTKTEQLYDYGRNLKVQKSNSPRSPRYSPPNIYKRGQRSNDDFDNYEDSDFYDSDSDLIRSFVLAVQPIYSMEEEPLYQYYTYTVSKPEDDYQPVIPKNLGLALDMLVPRVGQRTLWCELPEVVSSGILGILSDKQKQLQEAIFEVLTSEASYLKSLDVVVKLFYESSELRRILSEEEFRYIWGNIIQVKKCSQSFHAALVEKWEESWYIQEIGDLLNYYALNHFNVYKEYCRNKPHQDRIIQRLRMTNDDFVGVVKSIEENPKCQLLRMDSFLMLPMQRITRLPLLVNAIIQRLQSLKEKAFCEEALTNLTNLVLDCNDAARESQDKEDTTAVIEKIDFPRQLQNVTLGNFIIKGDFMKNPFENNGKGGNQINWTFRKTKRTYYWLLLFSEKLLITKKKSSGRFEVIDYAQSLDSEIKPLPNIDAISKDVQCQSFFMLHFTTKETVYFLGARTQAEVQRWKHKLEGLKNESKTNVEALFPYEAQREDEMSFDAGDIIRVVEKQADGWCFGMKINDDNESGWFPGNYCCESYSCS